MLYSRRMVTVSNEQKELFFYGDHTASVHPRIMNAIIEANKATPQALSYLRDPLTKSLGTVYSQIFGSPENTTKVYPVITGSAANALAISSMLNTNHHGGVLYCAPKSHVNIWENGAPETLSHGLIKIVGVLDHERQPPSSKVSASALDQLICSSIQGSKHKAHLGLSISIPTEEGELYSRKELSDLREVADKHKLLIHIDGARLAQGLVASGMNAKEFYDIIRPDILSFGQIKNGGYCEAIIVFNETLNKDFDRVLTSGAHMITRSRLYSAATIAYVENNLWIDNAKEAINAAHILYEKLSKAIQDGRIIDITLQEKNPTNRVVINASESLLKILDSNIHLFYRGGSTARLMTSYNTTEEDINDLVARMEILSKEHALHSKHGGHAKRIMAEGKGPGIERTGTTGRTTW
jgi:threonine aldolase